MEDHVRQQKRAMWMGCGTSLQSRHDFTSTILRPRITSVCQQKCVERTAISQEHPEAHTMPRTTRREQKGEENQMPSECQLQFNLTFCEIVHLDKVLNGDLIITVKKIEHHIV